MTKTYTIQHITGYTETTEDNPGQPIIETITATRDQLIDRLYNEDNVDHLIETGRLGEHDEWVLV